MHRIRLLIILSLFSFARTLAVPARPGITEFVQPDSTVVSVKIYGDEKFHYYLSADDYTLIAKADTLFFAEPGTGDTLIATPFIAADKENRSETCKEYLKSIDRAKVMGNLKRQSEKMLKRFNRIREDAGIGLFPDASFPTVGSTKALVLLVAFQDIKFSTDYDAEDYFRRMLNQPGFSDLGAYGSAADYFRENSCGAFAPEFDVIGPITLSRPEAFYGINGLDVIDRNAGLMVVDACKMIDHEIDFSQYDCDDDGYIDNVFVFYAGKGEASGGDPLTIWPHSSDVKYFTDENVILDGKILGRYACSNEIQNNQPDGIGTFVHEFAHVMGLPDLYATSYTDAFTPGSWDVMDYGSYNNNSRTPPLMSSFERHALGWTIPAETSSRRLVIPALGENHSGVVYSVTDNERYYLETRIQHGWDEYIPAEGMLIWHVNYSPAVWSRNTVNNSPDQQYVDIIEADRTLGENSRTGDCFPGASGVKSVDADSHPDLATWADSASPFSLTEISFDGNRVSAIFSAGSESFGLDAPQLNEDIQTTSTSFRISWSEVEGAEAYEIDVRQVKENQMFEENINFDSGSSGLPPEWDVKLGFTSTDILNPEDSSPMLMFLQNGGIITSPEFESAISAIEFSVMAAGRLERQPFVEVYIPDGDTWTLLDRKILTVNESLTHLSYCFDKDEVRRFRLRFGGEQGVKIFCDNLNISYPVASLEVPVRGFPISDYRYAWIDITGLMPATTYSVSIQATGYGARSEITSIQLTTAESASVQNLTADHPFTVYGEGSSLMLIAEKEADAEIISIDGRILQKSHLYRGVNNLDIRHRGIIFIKVDDRIFKASNNQ